MNMRLSSSEILSKPAKGHKVREQVETQTSKFELFMSSEIHSMPGESAAPDLSSDIQSLRHQVHELEIQQQKIGALEQL
ncbi:unnamed protein product [Sphagnum tenellum]